MDMTEAGRRAGRAAFLPTTMSEDALRALFAISCFGGAFTGGAIVVWPLPGAILAVVSALAITAARWRDRWQWPWQGLTIAVTSSVPTRVESLSRESTPLDSSAPDEARPARSAPERPRVFALLGLGNTEEARRLIAALPRTTPSSGHGSRSPSHWPTGRRTAAPISTLPAVRPSRSTTHTNGRGRWQLSLTTR